MYTVNGLIANILGFIISLAIIVAMVFCYTLLHTTQPGKSPSLFAILLYAICIILPGIIIHELLHGITAAHFAPGKWKAIKYGILWKYAAPYCACTEPLRINHYRLVALMPFIVFSIVPYMLSLIFAKLYLLTFASIMTLLCGADILVTLMTVRLPHTTLVRDHEKALGFHIIE